MNGVGAVAGDGLVLLALGGATLDAGAAETAVCEALAGLLVGSCAAGGLAEEEADGAGAIPDELVLAEVVAVPGRSVSWRGDVGAPVLDAEPVGPESAPVARGLSEAPSSITTTIPVSARAAAVMATHRPRPAYQARLPVCGALACTSAVPSDRVVVLPARTAGATRGADSTDSACVDGGPARTVFICASTEGLAASGKGRGGSPLPVLTAGSRGFCANGARAAARSATV